MKIQPEEIDILLERHDEIVEAEVPGEGSVFTLRTYADPAQTILLGEGAYYAPELTRVYARRGPDFIAAMLRDPEAMYPGQRRSEDRGRRRDSGGSEGRRVRADSRDESAQPSWGPPQAARRRRSRSPGRLGPARRRAPAPGWRPGPRARSARRAARRVG